MDALTKANASKGTIAKYLWKNGFYSGQTEAYRQKVFLEI